jgi:hypothetical protein
LAVLQLPWSHVLGSIGGAIAIATQLVSALLMTM